MGNVLKLSITEQNQFNPSLLTQSFNDRKLNQDYTADQTECCVAEETINDFESCPESFDFAFEYSYDEISAAAKEERKNIIERMLALEGYERN